MIDVTATLRQPVTAASGREAAFTTRAFGYIPGWVARGALAAVWIREHGVPSTSPRRADFVSIFEGNVRFGPLLSPTASFEPLSVSGCKYRPHPACATTAVDAAQPGSTGENRCTCGLALEPLKGRLVGSPLTSRARAELTSMETATDGQLFERQELATRHDGDTTTLVGSIDTADLRPDLVDELFELATRPVWFGGKKSTNGRAQLAFVPSDALAAPPVRSDGKILVRCASPMIVVDDATRPSQIPDRREVADALGVAHADLHLEQRWVRPELIGGWHAASGLPKPAEIAIATGSTFVYRCDSPIDRDHLSNLQRNGLGLRQREGFGWIDVNPAAWTPPISSAPRPSAPTATTASDDPLSAIPDERRSWAADLVRRHAMNLELGRASAVRTGEAGRQLAPDAGRQLRAVLDSNDLAYVHVALATIDAAPAATPTDTEGGATA